MPRIGLVNALAWDDRMLWLVLATAAALRFWGIRHGLPYEFTPDEAHEILRALKLGAGEYDWRGFGKGGLYLIMFVEYGLIYLGCWLIGVVGNAEDFALLYVTDPTIFYLAGRVTNTLLGISTCLAIYHLGKLLDGRRVGLLAALMMAASTVHASYSQLVSVDIGMSLFMVLSLVCYFKYEQAVLSRWLVLAGACAGLAVAFKLPGGMTAVVVLLAIATHPSSSRRWTQRLTDSGVFLIAMLLAVSVVAPEWVFRVQSMTGNFLGGVLSEPTVATVEPSAPRLPAYDGDSPYALGVGRYYRWLFEPKFFICTILAVVGSISAVRRRTRWVLIFSAATLLMLGVFGLTDKSVRFHYLLPILPMLWLVAAHGISRVGGSRGWVVALLAFAVVLEPASSQIRANIMSSKPDTRLIARDWIESNVQSGARVLMDGGRFRYNESPPIRRSPESLDRMIEVIEGERRVSRGVSVRTLELYRRATEQGEEGPTYDIHLTAGGRNLRDLDHYVNECFELVVISAGTRIQAAHPVFYGGLQEDSRFELVLDARSTPWEVKGPDVQVYRVRHACRVEADPLQGHQEDRESGGVVAVAT
jgi:4-amino-4-deoxy-L-arabinose transferase-like glycosyltransferase